MNLCNSALTSVAAVWPPPNTWTTAIPRICLSVKLGMSFYCFALTLEAWKLMELCVVISFEQTEAEQHRWGVTCSKAGARAGNKPTLPHQLSTPRELKSVTTLLVLYSMTMPWHLRCLHEHLQSWNRRTCTWPYLVVGNSHRSPCRSHCCPPPGSWGSSRTCWGCHLTREGARGPAFGHGSPWQWPVHQQCQIAPENNTTALNPTKWQPWGPPSNTSCN